MPDSDAVKPDYCLQFDGVNDAVAIPHSRALKFNPNNAFTIECWFKTSATTTAAAFAVLLGTWSGATITDPYPYELRFYAGPTFAGGAAIEFVDYDGSIYDSAFAQGPWNNAEWHHVAGVRRGTKWMGLYIDGVVRVPLTPKSGIGPITNTRPVTVGAYDNGFAGYKGLIDEVRIWNVARTKRQIRDNMNVRLPGSTPHLAGYWKLNDAKGTIAHDATANHNNGTLLNGPVWVPVVGR